MRITSLKIQDIEPLLPPGVEPQANQFDPVAILIEKFNTWAQLHNRTLENLTALDLYRRLSELGGVGSGPITPRTVENGRRPANPLVVEQALQRLREAQAAQPQDNVEPPLLPPGTN